MLRPFMLAIDYHFWIVVEGWRLKIFSEIEAYDNIMSISSISGIDHNKVEFCNLVYLAYMCNKYLETKDILKDINFNEKDKDYQETKKGEKEKNQEIEDKISEFLVILKKKYDPKNPERLITERLKIVPEKEKKEKTESLTKNLIHDLIESGKIPTSETSLRGKMKILRITTTEVANTVFKILGSSISKLQGKLGNYMLPDILIDTGKYALSLDQLSFISRMKLAEKVLSSEDFDLFQKHPNKLSKDKKCLEYINLHNFPCILILVAKGRQGDTFPNSFDCLDMRAKSDSNLPTYSSFTQEFGRLCRYVDIGDKKPIALVSDKIYRDLTKSNTNMKLDNYVTQIKEKESQKYWSTITLCRRTMHAVKKPKETSYDFMRSGPEKDISTKKDHNNRLLLFAEPQIGKTDSFLHFLERTVHAIETNTLERMEDINKEEHAQDDLSISVGESINREYSDLERMLPYFDYLQAQKKAEYSSISAGKYAKLVLKTREEAFKEFYPDRIRSVHKLSRIESFITSSNHYWDKFIEKLSGHEFNVETFQTFDGRYNDVLHPGPRSSLKILRIGDSNASKSPKIANKVDLSKKMNIGLADMNYKDKLLTVQLQKVFGFQMQNLESCFLGEKPQISIPSNKMDWFQISPNQKNVVSFLSPKDPNSVRSWIFMPSCNRSASGLFYMQSLDASYRQVIVVRHSEFKCYRNVLGNDFVIMSMPDIMDMNTLLKIIPTPSVEARKSQYTHAVEKTNIVDYHLKDDIGGIGYTRMFIQIFSFYFHLEFIWMMDDNCHHFEKVENGTKIPCSLSEVLIPLERIVYDENEPLSTITSQIGTTFNNRQSPSTELTINDKISSFTPGKEKIAVIGVRKDGFRYSPTTNYKPFVNSFTICSLFLLNTNVTVGTGCLFPSRRYLEDIEFEYLCMEKGLYCIKSQNYFLYKPANPLRIDYSPPISGLPILYEIDETTFQQINERLSGTQPSPEYQAIMDFLRNSSEASTILENSNSFYFTSLNQFIYPVYTFVSEKSTTLPALLNFVKMFPHFEIFYYSPQSETSTATEIIIKIVKKSEFETE